jgi:hypothetical protein
MLPKGLSGVNRIQKDTSRLGATGFFGVKGALFRAAFSIRIREETPHGPTFVPLPVAEPHVIDYGTLTITLPAHALALIEVAK